MLVQLKKVNIFLYFSACIVNLTSFTCGVVFAWSSPVLPKLQSNTDNPLGRPLTEDEASWVASLLPLGAIIAPYAAGYLADKIGRKRTLIFSIVPTIACFLLLAFGNHLYLYYLARFVLGLTALGTPLTVVPMFIGEVAEIHNRGTLGCFTVLYVSLGFLFSFAVGPYASIMTFNLLCAIPGLICLVVFTLMIPESPSYLIIKDNLEGARRSLQKFRLGPIEKEFSQLECNVKKFMDSKGGIRDILRSKSLFKACCVSMSLMMIQQSTAMSVMTFYLQFIFKSAGSPLPPEIATIIIGVVQLIGCIISTVTVDKFGRRILLLTSTITTSITLIVISIYFYLLTIRDVSSIGWIPILALVFYRIAYGFGIGSLPQTILSEIFPPNIKSVAASLTVCTCFLFSFATSKIFPVLEAAVDNWFAFMMFAICNSLGVVFIWFLVPETKGKTLAEILKSFE